jgi:hypothetical protein
MRLEEEKFKKIGEKRLEKINNDSSINRNIG